MVRVAQLNLLFAGEDGEVVEAARQVTESLVLVSGRVLRVGLESFEESEQDEKESEQEEEGISDEIQEANQLLAEFAALANSRVRPRPLLRDLT